MLPLHTQAMISGVKGKAILKVLTLEEAQKSDIDPSCCLIWKDVSEQPPDIEIADNWAGVISNQRALGRHRSDQIVVDEVKSPSVVKPGDVIRLVEGRSRISVVYRRGSNSNTLMATERCNSFCLMCSQPPRDVDDQWYVDEMLATIPLVDRDEIQLGISGGEPTLLGDNLAVVIHQARRHLPTTGLHILSNGRRFSDEAFARVVNAVRHPALVWGIPVYSECPETHDFIVQSRGAWDETLAGLYNLAKHGASIEIRIVVQQANVARLGELAYFIFRNLTFVEHVAIMGLEPMGFARRNYDKLWVDPADCSEALREAVFFLANRGMTVSVYNFPLCTLPREIWPFCPKSISDWKNIYLPECNQCDVQDRCCGFFQTVGEKWVSRAFEPVKFSNAGSTQDRAVAI